jgi:hypothetical protein
MAKLFYALREKAPEYVGGDFYCSGNKLKSLKGIAKNIKGGLYISKNELTSLEGCPKIIGKNFNIYINKLKSLKYGPLPEVLMTALVPVQERFRKLKINLVLEGLSEGILYYRLDADEGVLCGAGGKMLHESFLKELENIKSQNNLKLIARDCAPLAVYGGSN